MPIETPSEAIRLEPVRDGNGKPVIRTTVHPFDNVEVFLLDKKGSYLTGEEPPYSHLFEVIAPGINPVEVAKVEFIFWPGVGPRLHVLLTLDYSKAERADLGPRFIVTKEGKLGFLGTPGPVVRISSYTYVVVKEDNSDERHESGGV